MLEKEMIEMAKRYKRRVAGSFVLVDADKISGKVAGSRFVATKKIDGTLQALFYENGEVTAVSTSGKITKGLPCLEEAAAQMKSYGLKSAVIEAELYAVLENGKRERVGDVATAVADKKLWNKLLLAPFDIVSLDGEEYRNDNYSETIRKLYAIFDGKLVKPVEYKELFSLNDVSALFKQWCEDGRAEGIVLHSEMPVVYKIKTRHSIDGVIVGFTCGVGENSDSVRDVAVALMREDGLLQIIGVTGNGFTTDQKKDLAKKLETLACESEYIITDSRNVAFQMVKPQIVGEFSAGDFVAESSDGTPKTNPILNFDEEKGYLSEGMVPGVSTLHFVFNRFRDDKAADKSDIRIAQITDVCPFSEGKSSRLTDLPKSEVLAKRIFTKGSGDKLMIQKYVIWKTNKEETGAYPAYVFFYTDFSSGRKDMLKRDLRVSSDKEQAFALMEQAIAENVKKGWVEQK